MNNKTQNMETNENANPQLADENKMVQCSTPLIGSGAMALIKNVIVENMQPKVQVWRSARDVRNYKYLTLDELANIIASRENDKTIIGLRNLNTKYVETGNLEYKIQYDLLKPKLPLCTLTSNMDNYRNEKHIHNFLGLCVLDIDIKDNPLLPKIIKSLKNKFSNSPLTLLNLTSPRGEGYGLKVVVKIYLNEVILQCNEELNNCKDAKRREELVEIIKDFYSVAHKSIRDYFINMFNDDYTIVFDTNAKNIQGEAFLSGDANVYYNPNSSPFQVAWVKKEKKVPQMNTYNTFNYTATSNDEILEAILNDFTKNCNGRNMATFNIALQAKHYNISENEILSFVMNKWGDTDFNEKEALRAIRNGFKYTPYVQYVFNSNNSNNI
ncbi:MAG: BT4734/BF3469 family protein [Bacteroidales bacterium]|nr:BT4734/BF3469 family protein [Bacteroidales bacterium]